MAVLAVIQTKVERDAITAFFPGARRRNVRPVVDGLESRELLSTAPAVAAQVSMISGQEMSQKSIVGQLPSVTPTIVSTIPSNGDVNP